MGWINQLYTSILIFVLGRACVGLRYGWKPRQEFTFSVEGQSMVAFQGTEHEGFDYKGQMRVHSVADNILHLQLTEFTYNKFRNTTVGSPLPITSATVVVTMFKSKEPHLTLPPGVADWEINFIKGLVSFITVSYGRDVYDQTSNSLDENLDLYTIMEDTVVGRCQVLYEINKLPEDFSQQGGEDWSFCRDQPVIEIVKTLNYSGCDVLNEDSYGLPVSYKRNAYEDIWTRASSTRLLGCGTERSFVLVSSVSESQIVAKLHLRNNSESQVNSRLHVKLQSMQTSPSSFRPPPNYVNVAGLLYNYQCQDEAQKPPPSPAPPQLPFSVESNNNKVLDRGDDEIQTDDGLLYERRRRSVRKSKKFPKYTHIQRGRNNFDAEIGSSESKSKPSDTSSTAPRQKPYTPFFLEHRFTVDCGYGVTPSPSYAKDTLSLLIDDIAGDLADAATVARRNTMEKLSMAADYARLVSLADLQSLSKNIFENTRYPEYETRAALKRNVFRDVVTLSGQRASFKLISDWIKNKQVNGEEAAQIVSALPSHLTPSDPYVLREFFDLTVAAYNGSDHQLKVTAILAFSSYVRASVSPAGARNQTHEVKKYIDWLAAHLLADKDLEIVFVRAVGNIPGETSVSVLKSVATNKSVSVQLRTTAVFSMIFSAFYCKAVTTTALLSLYHNATLPTPVRIASVSLLFYATRDITVWQRIALSTWTGEQNSFVSAFVWSTLQNLANNNGVRHSFLPKAAAQVKSMAKPAPSVAHQPFHILKSTALHQLSTVVTEILTWQCYSDFRSLYYRHNTLSSGLSRGNFQTELSVTNFYGFLDALQDMFLPKEAKPQRNKLFRSTEWIKDTLKLTPRVMPSFEARLHLKIHDLVERMFSVDKKGLLDLAQEFRQLLVEISGNGKDFYYQKSGMMTSLRIATTTEMGFPVEFRVEDPWSLRMSAGLQIRSSSLQLNTTFMYASQRMSDIGVYSSWDSVQHTVGLQTSNVIQLPPLSLTAQYDKENSIFQIQTKEIGKTDLFHWSNAPFSVQKDVQHPKPIVVGIHGKLLNKTKMSQDSETIPGVPIEITREGDSLSPADPIRLSSLSVSMLSRSTAKPYKYKATMGNLQPINLNFSIGSAVVINGERRIRARPTPLTYLNRINSILSDKDSNKDRDEEPLASDLILTAQYSSNYMRGLTVQDEGSIASNLGLFRAVINETENPTDNVTNATIPTQPPPPQTPCSQGCYPVICCYPLDCPIGCPGCNQVSTPCANTTSSPTTTAPSTTEVAPTDVRPTEAVPTEVGTTTPEPTVPSTTTKAATTSNFTQKFDSIIEETTHSINYSLQIQQFNASSCNPFAEEVNVSASDYLLSTVLDGVKNGKAYAVDLNFSMGHVNITALLTHAFTFDNLFQRVGAFIKMGDNSQFGLTTTVAKPVTPLFSVREFVTANPTTNVVADFTYNGNRNLIIQGNVSTKGDDDSLSPNFDIDECTVTIPGKAIGPDCRKLINQLSTQIDRLEFTVTQPGSGNSSQRDKFSLDISNTEEGPTIDLTLPNEIRIDGVLLHNQLPYYQAMNSRPAYCGITTKRVITFDDAEYFYGISHSWHLAVTDCSDQSQVAILTRLSQSNTTVDIEVNVGNVLVLTIQAQGGISINGQDKNWIGRDLHTFFDENDVELMRVYRSSDNALGIQLPQHGFEITYAYAFIVIDANPSMRGRLCGLCGMYTGEGAEQYWLPHAKRADSAFTFAQSYMLNDFRGV